MTDMSVYMINSLLSINNALAFYELGVNQRLEMLQVIAKQATPISDLKNRYF